MKVDTLFGALEAVIHAVENLKENVDELPPILGIVLGVFKRRRWAISQSLSDYNLSPNCMQYKHVLFSFHATSSMGTEKR